MANTKMVTITDEEYQSLLKDQDCLRCLEDGGVDNWEWHWESLNDGGFFKRWYPEEAE